jgi:hypothetical protein
MGVSPSLYRSTWADIRQMYFAKQVDYITRYIHTYGHIIDRFEARAALKFHFGVSQVSLTFRQKLMLRDCLRKVDCVRHTSRRQAI